MNEEPILRKAYYSIGEVCDLTDLKPHVLRYWETQFESLRPTKNRAGNRVYRPREVELVLLVKHLLYEKKFTIDGARQELQELRKGGELNEERQEVAGPELFQVMKEELVRLQELLTLPPSPSPAEARPSASVLPASPPAAGAPGAVDDSPSDPEAPGASGGTLPRPAASSPPPAPDDRYPQLQLEVDDG